MNTKRIGNIGEVKTLSKFVEMGIPVYIPFGDNERADMIAEFNGKLQKIQVKTSVAAKDGVMHFDLTSSTTHRLGGLKYIYTEHDIDYFALYNLERDSLMLIHVSDTQGVSINIRYEPPKNNQKIGIRFEDDYLFKNILCVETLHETPKD